MSIHTNVHLGDDSGIGSDAVIMRPTMGNALSKNVLCLELFFEGNRISFFIHTQTQGEQVGQELRALSDQILDMAADLNSEIIVD